MRNEVRSTLIILAATGLACTLTTISHLGVGAGLIAYGSILAALAALAPWKSKDPSR